jgi:hypothetical protein
MARVPAVVPQGKALGAEEPHAVLLRGQVRARRVEDEIERREDAGDERRRP